jgi:TrkA domain protein
MIKGKIESGCAPAAPVSFDARRINSRSRGLWWRGFITEEAQTMGTRRTPLPGVGTQYDLATRDGRHISVVAHEDGRRFIAFYDPEDPDTCQGTVPLEAEEAERLAGILAPERAPSDDEEAAEAAALDARAKAKAKAKFKKLLYCDELELDLVTKRIPIEPDSPYRGRPMGDTKARTRTGASIVAVLRRTGAHPSPGPDFRLEAGDTLLVVGTREGVDDLADIIAGA